jgi:tRNA G18 (ribose-2'-O)-methylase SpoU
LTRVPAFLENILTDNRKKFQKVLQNRTKHFTIAVEDIFQMQYTSAVMRSCEIFGIQELNVISVTGKVSTRKLRWALKMGRHQYLRQHYKLSDTVK